MLRHNNDGSVLLRYASEPPSSSGIVTTFGIAGSCGMHVFLSITNSLLFYAIHMSVEPRESQPSEEVSQPTREGRTKKSPWEPRKLLSTCMNNFHMSANLEHLDTSICQYAQYQHPETEAAKWDTVIIRFIIYTCASCCDMSLVEMVYCRYFWTLTYTKV